MSSPVTVSGRMPGGWLLLLLGALLPLAMLVATARGAYHIDMAQLLWALLERSGFIAADARADQVAVLWYLRLPRVFLAALIGAALVMTGACLQALFRNPLADPALVGVSSGAAVAVAGLIVLGNLVWSNTGNSELLQPVVAFVGAVVAAVVVYRIGCTAEGISVAAMLLAGIAINALALTLIGLASFVATDEQLRNLTFWSLGSLSSASWPVVGMVVLGVLPALLMMQRLIPGLNALALGEIEAHHLGVNVEALKYWAILAAALAVGASVAFCGIIGFIGLVAPHMVRLLAGPDARWVLPGAALFGANLTVIADMAARTLVAPAEMPIGVLTALIGAPFSLGYCCELEAGCWRLRGGLGGNNKVKTRVTYDDKQLTGCSPVAGCSRWQQDITGTRLPGSGG